MTSSERSSQLPHQVVANPFQSSGLFPILEKSSGGLFPILGIISNPRDYSKSSGGLFPILRIISNPRKSSGGLFPILRIISNPQKSSGGLFPILRITSNPRKSSGGFISNPPFVDCTTPDEFSGRHLCVSQKVKRRIKICERRRAASYRNYERRAGHQLLE